MEIRDSIIQHNKYVEGSIFLIFGNFWRIKVWVQQLNMV